MAGWVLGVIGGSGLYGVEGLTNARWTRVDSPFGAPSDELLIGELGHVRLVFLPRHGRGHRLPPSAINARANIGKAQDLVRILAERLPPERAASPIDTALDGAIITAPEARDPIMLQKLSAIVGRALGVSSAAVP